MKIEINNSTVEFKDYDPIIYDADVVVSNNQWQYLTLLKDVKYHDTVKTTVTVDAGKVSLLTGLQVKPYVGGSIINAPFFTDQDYVNSFKSVTSYEHSDISQVGLFVNGSEGLFPVTVHIKMEWIGHIQ